MRSSDLTVESDCFDAVLDANLGLIMISRMQSFRGSEVARSVVDYVRFRMLTKRADPATREAGLGTVPTMSLYERIRVTNAALSQ
jgi:hypothetical protein